MNPSFSLQFSLWLFVTFFYQNFTILLWWNDITERQLSPTYRCHKWTLTRSASKVFPQSPPPKSGIFLQVPRHIVLLSVCDAHCAYMYYFFKFVLELYPFLFDSFVLSHLLLTTRRRNPKLSEPAAFFRDWLAENIFNEFEKVF